MDLYLNKESINYAREVLNTNVAQEETMEMIVPDAQPDILRIVDTDVNTYVRSKDTETGRITLTGTASVTVIYLPEGLSTLRRLNVEVPFSIAAADAEITPESKVIANVNAISVDSSVINTRKLIVRVNLLANLVCYSDSESEFFTGLPETDEIDIEALTENCNISVVTDVSEKTFVISDELTLSASNPPIGNILKATAQLVPNEVKQVGNKLIVKGTSAVQLMYNPADGGEATGADFNTEFSQILEIEEAGDNADFDVALILTSAYFDIAPDMAQTEGRRVNAEIHAVAQCATVIKKNVSYIADVYSTKFDLESSTTDTVIPEKMKADKPGVAARGFIDTPTAVSQVLCVTVRPGEVNVTEDGNVADLKTDLNASAVYIDDEGRISSANGKIPAATRIDTANTGHCKGSAVCDGDIFASATSNGIDIRANVSFSAEMTGVKSISQVYGVSYDEDEPKDHSKMPSLSLTRPRSVDSMWKLAKRHNSTPELIATANGLESTNELQPGQMLIIPKKR